MFAKRLKISQRALYLKTHTNKCLCPCLNKLQLPDKHYFPTVWRELWQQKNKHEVPKLSTCFKTTTWWLELCPSQRCPCNSSSKPGASRTGAEIISVPLHHMGQMLLLCIPVWLQKHLYFSILLFFCLPLQVTSVKTTVQEHSI